MSDKIVVEQQMLNIITGRDSFNAGYISVELLLAAIERIKDEYEANRKPIPDGFSNRVYITGKIELLEDILNALK